MTAVVMVGVSLQVTVTEYTAGIGPVASGRSCFIHALSASENMLDATMSNLMCTRVERSFGSSLPLAGLRGSYVAWDCLPRIGKRTP